VGEDQTAHVARHECTDLHVPDRVRRDEVVVDRVLGRAEQVGAGPQGVGQQVGGRLALEEAELLVEQEQGLNVAVAVLREQEEDHVKRIDTIQEQLAAQVKACYLAEAEAQQNAEKVEQIKLELDDARHSRDVSFKLVEEAALRLRAHEEARKGVQVNTQKRAEQEQKLNAEIEALRHAEDEQQRRIEEAESRLRAQEEARQAAKAKVKQLAESEQQVLAEIETLSKTEAELLNRIKEADARLPGHEEAVRQAEAQAQREADEESQRLRQLEAICEKAQAEAAQRKTREQTLNSRIESLQAAEHVDPISEYEIAGNDVAFKPVSLEPDFAEVTPQSVISDIEIVDEQMYSPETPSLADNLSGNEPHGDELPWLVIDLDHSGPVTPVTKEIDFVTADTAADLANHEAIDPEPVHNSTIDLFSDESEMPADKNGDSGSFESSSPELMARLQSSHSPERAAALADLADFKGDDSFRLITKSFDDPSVEVRNAAARALYHLQPDLSASFTRALREASPERRRKIGAAIAGSGLAANAINSLTGEGRDRTYDAFSMLFLMAKAGEVQPLMQAIAKHPDHEVRLTAVKLLALSNQPQILPAFRNLAARENLPADVHTAVMEAIFLLSTQAREVA